MIKLVIPTIEHKDKYKEMIEEWQEHGGPYVPCIIDYDCNNPIEELDYDAVLKVVNDYRNGNVFDDDTLIGMSEIRHNLKPLGIKTIGHIACGIRPSQRGKGYALKSTEYMLEKLKEDGIDEAVLCHYSENNISPKIIKKLDFKYKDSMISEVSKKEIKRYIKKLK